jgi:hypothetical protein
MDQRSVAIFRAADFTRLKRKTVQSPYMAGKIRDMVAALKVFRPVKVISHVTRAK